MKPGVHFPGSTSRTPATTSLTKNREAPRHLIARPLFW